MKAHITKSEQDRLLEETIKENLNKARSAGLLIGARAVSKVILDKAEKATPETAMEVIADIIDFCKISLKENTGG